MEAKTFTVNVQIVTKAQVSQLGISLGMPLLVSHLIYISSLFVFRNSRSVAVKKAEENFKEIL